MRIPTGFHNDDPAWPVVWAKISYVSITTADGDATGVSLIDRLIPAAEPDYKGHSVKILTGAAAGQVRRIADHTDGQGLDPVVGQMFVDRPFGSDVPGAIGTTIQILAGTRYVILSDFSDEILFFSFTTGPGDLIGSTLIDTRLPVYFPDPDRIIGNTVILHGYADQQREIYDYDPDNNTIVLSPIIGGQIAGGDFYMIKRARPSIGGGGPQPEPSVEETSFQLEDYDDFEWPDPTADTERWSSEYLIGVADGVADINTTTPDNLHIDITAVAVAAAEYGVRRINKYLRGDRYFTLADLTCWMANYNVNYMRAGIAISSGDVFDPNNYIRIYVRGNNVNNRQLVVEYNLGGVGPVLNVIVAAYPELADTSFSGLKIERIGNMWRCYYSNTIAPHHHWILAQEIEDPANNMGDPCRVYLTAYNPEDAAGQEVDADFSLWESYYSLGMLGDIISIITPLLAASKPQMSLYEGWQDELGIDFTLWTVVNPATPPPWARGPGVGVMAAMLRATAAPQANEIARLVGNQRWPVAPNVIGPNTIIRVLNIEFEMSIGGLLNLDNTACFFGFTPNQADTRVAQNIVGFALIGAGNALQTVTDLLGVETLNTGFGENLANLNKFRIQVLSVGAVRTVQFYLNEVLIASHIATLPDLPMFPNWYFDTNAGGATTPQIAIVRIWTLDMPLP